MKNIIVLTTLIVLAAGLALTTSHFLKNIPITIPQTPQATHIIPSSPSSTPPNSTLSPEIQSIVTAKYVAAQAPILKQLIERVGIEQTQEEMYRSGLPFTGETHLLIHVVGDYIYDKYGLAGLPKCKDYFLSACYHGFVLHAIADYGIGGVVEALKECAKGGVHVMAQCSHAVGHGFLAWNDYDPLKTLPMCDEAGSKTTGFGYFNCYDGVFMENFWAVHEGKPSPKRWIKADDPHYPCNDPRITEKYLNGCWANQATVMYQMFGGNLEKTAEGCDSIDNRQYKETCYNNFSRQIHPLTMGRADKAFELCKNATSIEWQNYCLITLVQASFSVGDQTNMPVAICDNINEETKSRCFDTLFSLIRSYTPADTNRALDLCKNIQTAAFRDKCITYQQKQY